MVTSVEKGNTSTGSETVSDLLDLWLDHCDSLGRSATTMREYRRITERTVRPKLGSKKLNALTAQDLDKLYRELTAKGNKPATVRRVHALIGAALKQAEKWGLVDRNVARLASPPPARTVQVTAPTAGEVQLIIRAAEQVEPTMAAMLIIAALTGARRGELCALRWTDLDLAAGTLTIARSVYETAGGGWNEKGTKTHQGRRISLDPVVIETLRRHRESVDRLAAQLDVTVREDAFMFSRSPAGAEPMRPDHVTKFMSRVAASVGVNTHLHALRHFAATEAIAAGFDPVTVGGRLGHADPSITLRTYSHVLEQRDRELAASLGRTLALPSAEA